MASFTGSNKEFRRYIGPMLRNLVQQFTRKHKAEIGACEHCGTRQALESAHIHGRGRNELIDLILRDFIHKEIITVDLDIFEKRFKEEHQPLEKSILILCDSCHTKYDLPLSQTTQEKPETTQPLALKNSESILPITLEPSNTNEFKQELIKSKKAEIETIYTDGSVEKKLWKAPKFNIKSNLLGNLRSRKEYRSGNWQEKGIVKINVRVMKNN